jgi:hypothetical protein
MLRWIGRTIQRHLPGSVQRWLYWRAREREWRRLVDQVRRKKAQP